MRLLGQLLLVALVICAIECMIALLAIAIVLVIIWGLIWRPAETVSLLLFLLFLRALEVNAWATMGVTVACVAILLVASRKKREPECTRLEPPLLLPPPDDVSS